MPVIGEEAAIDKVANKRGTARTGQFRQWIEEGLEAAAEAVTRPGTDRLHGRLWKPQRAVSYFQEKDPVALSHLPPLLPSPEEES